MVIDDLKRDVKKYLSERDTYLLISGMLGISATDYALGGKKEVNIRDFVKTVAAAQKIANGYPLQYSVGYTEFMSLKFFVDESVLIPRPDTETLVEAVINGADKSKTYSLLDIGTGSGAVGISISHFISCRADLLDISAAALETARKNAEENHVNAEFIRCDILREVPQKKYDIIVSNPPYVESAVIPTLDKNVRCFEPHGALDGGKDGLIFYRRICSAAPKILSGGGLLAFEVGYNQAESVSELMKPNFEKIEILKDLCGVSRVVKGYLKGTKTI